ncbi:MAG: serine/threonine-protein kinase, partial [Kofleriaceae bacterium]
MIDDDDSLLREVAAAPAIAMPRDLATFVLLEPGTIVEGAFRIEARLGAGGMGVVYAARDLKLDREVALKLMRLDRGAAETLPEVFEREARATARLNHPNVVTLHQFGNWNGLLYLVLERLRGETLNARMDRGGLTLAEGLAIMEQVGRALVHTHAAGITHRDLKPQNVFLLDEGVKVLDFGVSGLGRMPEPPPGALATRGRSTLSLAGTPGYMAPEQWAGGSQGARTDLFALGVMLYQLVTGALPFGTSAIDPRATVPPVPTDVPDLGELIEACLQPAMDARPASAHLVVQRLSAIRTALGDTPTSRVRSSPGHLATARIERRSRLRRAGLIVAVTVVAGAIGAAMLTRGADDRCASGARLAGVWDLPARARLVARFGTTALWDEIARSLDTYAAQWQPLDESACRAGRPAVTACLDDHFAAYRRVIGELATLAPENAMSRVHTIPMLAECSESDYLAR